MRWMRRLYDWVLSWERSRHAGKALFLLAAAESSFFPVPPDVLLAALSLSAPRRALRYAVICSVGSVAGGALGYAIGRLFWEHVSGFFFAYILSHEAFDRVEALYAAWTFWAVFTAGFTPIPYKVFTITAGVFGISFPIFLLASAVSRSARFFLVAGLIGFFGPSAQVFIDKHFGWVSILFVALLVGGFILMKILP